jgi:hypothetical protein
VLLVFFAPILFEGQVIYPHDNSREIGAPPIPDEAGISNRRFSDLAISVIPELHLHLQGDHQGWLSTWNPHVELGRPTYQVNGISKAFLLTHLLSLASDDALEVYSWLTLTTVFSIAFFGYLLLQSMGLHPAACLTGSVGLSLGVWVSHYHTLVMFVAGPCWTLALLWLTKSFIERATLTRAVGIAFCVHALLLTTYPQQVVWQAYLLTWMTLIWLSRRSGPARERLSTFGKLALAVSLGLASVVPVYLDLLLNASRSIRIDLESSFYLASLPPTDGAREVVQFIGQLFDAFWFGNPIREEHAIPFNALCLTPLFGTLLLLSFTGGQSRRLWPWQVFSVVCLLTTLSESVYLFGVDYLGLWVSRWTPFQAAYVPIMVLAAHSADGILRHGLPRRGVGVSLVSGVALVAVVGNASRGLPIDAGLAAVGISLFAASLAFVWMRSPTLLLIVAIVSSFHYGARLRLTRPPGEIRTTSPLADLIRESTGDGFRFAWVGRAGIRSNEEVLLGLSSVHSYNSVAARSYERWVLRLGGGFRASGRVFQAFSSPKGLDRTELEYSGVDVLVSRLPLSPDIAAPVDRHRSFTVYRTLRAPRLEGQLLAFERTGAGRVGIRGSIPEAASRGIERVTRRDDQLELRLVPSSSPTLLFLSQQFHPQWRAVSGGAELETVEVNGFYQGVVLPEDTRSLELAFAPYARWSWIPQLLVLPAAAGRAIHWRRRRQATSQLVSPINPQNETELTRFTLVRILKESDRLGEFFNNPQRFMGAVASILKHELHHLLVDGIKYERIEGGGSESEWEMLLFKNEELIDYLTALQVQKSVHEYVPYDSEVEREFARKLDEREDIKLFVKLPGWFVIETPVGKYNPDWAILKHDGQALYLVGETKGTSDFLKLRTAEADKVRCGAKHFETPGAPFAVAVTADEV